ncbi:MAG: hypothetical protein WBQ95_05660 [Terracidiphilus sp.]
MLIGNWSLAAGLALWTWTSRTGEHGQPWLHAWCGFLLGLSIAINLRAVATRRRDRLHKV